MALWIIAGMTFREAARKKILWTALLAGLGFFVVFGLGLHYQMADFSRGSMSPFLRYQILGGMLMIGLYTVDLLAVVMTILTSVDTISGEIDSGTIHAIATKPIARWQVLVGKWMGFVGMLAIYGHRSGPSWAGVPGRMARADERIRRRLAAGGRRDRVEPGDAERGGVAAGGIRDGIAPRRVPSIFAVRRYFRTEPHDGWLCGRLSAGRAGHRNLSLSEPRPLSGPRFVRKLSFPFHLWEGVPRLRMAPAPALRGESEKVFSGTKSGLRPYEGSVAIGFGERSLGAVSEGSSPDGGRVVGGELEIIIQILH